MHAPANDPTQHDWADWAANCHRIMCAQTHVGNTETELQLICFVKADGRPLGHLGKYSQQVAVANRCSLMDPSLPSVS